MIRPHGSWPSPIDAEMVARHRTILGEVRTSGPAVWWTEGAPADQGRVSVWRSRPGEAPQRMTTTEFDVRTRVYEYGGGAYAVSGDDLVFVNLTDQRVYHQPAGRAAYPVTDAPPTPAAFRYADLQWAPGGFVSCVRERHQDGDVVHDIVALSVRGEAPVALVAGRDFYAAPRVSPDGGWLAWLEWDHPEMPWTSTTLKKARLADGQVDPEPTTVAGGPGESVLMPAWSPDGTLHFVSDRTGWWNLYAESGPGGAVEALTPMAHEVGWPPWLLGLSTYAFLPDATVALVHGVGPVWQLGLRSPDGSLHDIALPYPSFAPPHLRTLDRRVACVVASPQRMATVVVVDPADHSVEVLRDTTPEAVDPAWYSVPRHLRFDTRDGGHTYALVYPPANPDCEGGPEDLPPLLVISHGGPTSGYHAGLDLTVQFFTSRGFAVACVDYRGSTGHGRAYRDQLAGEWGDRDVADCVDVARGVAAAGLADRSRMAIRGASAGGYATLCALAFHDDFAAGTCFAGISDATTFVHDTHKFESRYLDWLIGPLPESESLYRARSPIHHLDGFAAPVLLLHGADDPIVPVAEAERMREALLARGVHSELIAFPGEQHGLRRADSVQRALEAELSFYSTVFRFPLPEVDHALARTAP